MLRCAWPGQGMDSPCPFCTVLTPVARMERVSDPRQTVQGLRHIREQVGRVFAAGAQADKPRRDPVAGPAGAASARGPYAAETVASPTNFDRSKNRSPCC